MVMSIILVLLGVVAMQRPADRAVPRDRPADGPGHDDVHRRQRHRRRSLGRHAARTEDQRRRKGHLPEVDQRQRRHADAQGLVRGRVEPGHGQRAHAEPRVRRPMPQMPQSVKNYGVTVKKALRVSAARHLDQVAERAATTATSCRTTRPSTSTTRSRASRASARSTCSAAATTRCGSGCGPIVIGRLGLTDPGHRQRDQPAEPADAGRTDRRPAGAPKAPSTPTPSARRAGCSTMRSSATSSSAPTRTAREVRLKDVARLELGTMLYNAVGRHDGKPAAVIAVFQIPGTNALDGRQTRSRRRWRT